MNPVLFVYLVGFLATLFLIVSSTPTNEKGTIGPVFWVNVLFFCAIWFISMPIVAVTSILHLIFPKK